MKILGRIAIHESFVLTDRDLALTPNFILGIISALLSLRKIEGEIDTAQLSPRVHGASACRDYHKLSAIDFVGGRSRVACKRESCFPE